MTTAYVASLTDGIFAISTVSKRLAEANAKSEKRLKDEVSKALAEAERQSKLSEAEREKEFKAKQQAVFGTR